MCCQIVRTLSNLPSQHLQLLLVSSFAFRPILLEGCEQMLLCRGMFLVLVGEGGRMLSLHVRERAGELHRASPFRLMRYPGALQLLLLQALGAHCTLDGGLVSCCSRWSTI